MGGGGIQPLISIFRLFQTNLVIICTLGIQYPLNGLWVFEKQMLNVHIKIVHFTLSTNSVEELESRAFFRGKRSLKTAPKNLAFFEGFSKINIYKRLLVAGSRAFYRGSRSRELGEKGTGPPTLSKTMLARISI